MMAVFGTDSPNIPAQAEERTRSSPILSAVNIAWYSVSALRQRSGGRPHDTHSQPPN